MDDFQLLKHLECHISETCHTPNESLLDRCEWLLPFRTSVVEEQVVNLSKRMKYQPSSRRSWVLNVLKSVVVAVGLVESEDSVKVEHSSLLLEVSEVPSSKLVKVLKKDCCSSSEVEVV